MSPYLTNLSIPAVLIGMALTAAAVAALYIRWKMRPKRHGWLVPLGWLLLIVSAWPWAMAAGADRGISAALVLWSLVALGIIALRPARGEWLTVKTGRANTAGEARESLGKRVLARRAGRFVITGVLGFGAALGCAFALFALAGGSEANRLVGSAMALVVLWSVFMAWGACDSRPGRPAAWLAAITALGFSLSLLG